MKTFVFALLALFVTAGAVSAQVPIQPTVATFGHSDADFTKTASYRFEFFQCASVQVGPPEVCVGKASAPFQTGTSVAKGSVTGTAAVRSVSLTAVPLSGGLAALPAGVAFVAEVIAVGDPAQGASGEGRSADSNAFFPRASSVAAPTSVIIR